MRKLDGANSNGPRTAASPAAAAKNTDSLVGALDTTTPARQPVIKPADLVKAKYTRNAAGEIVPVEANAKPVKSTLASKEDGFTTGLDEGMKDLPEVKEAGPEGIDFAADGGKAGADGEYYITSQSNSNILTKPKGPKKIDYRRVFFQKYPELKGKVIVHHSIEQQTILKFPDLFQPEEINKLDYLQGIPKEINNEVHLSEIRSMWSQFYDDIEEGTIAANKENFIAMKEKIDKIYGKRFNPPIE